MKRSKPLRRTPLKKVGEKRAKESKIYEAAKKQYLADNPECQIGPAIRSAGFSVRCKGVATHVHHVAHRGANLSNPEYFMSSCSGECHPQWVHQTHVKEAYQLGLLK